MLIKDSTRTIWENHYSNLYAHESNRSFKDINASDGILLLHDSIHIVNFVKPFEPHFSSEDITWLVISSSEVLNIKRSSRCD